MHRSGVISLLTDFGNQDAYVGIMKGVIAGINPGVHIIDICHNILPHDIFNGAYLLSTSYKYFPKGTIHVAVIDPGVGGARGIVCVETQDYLFLAPNNGLLSFIARKERLKNIIHITNSKYFLPSPGHTFHGRDIFAPVAAHLSRGIKTRQLGTKMNQLECLDIPEPHFKKPGQLEGQIISIDRFGNLITNITRIHVESLALGQKDREVIIGKKKVFGLSKTYADVSNGKPLILIGSAGFLEISVNQGNAQKYFNVDRGSKISICLMKHAQSR